MRRTGISGLRDPANFPPSNRPGPQTASFMPVSHPILSDPAARNAASRPLRPIAKPPPQIPSTRYPQPPMRMSSPPLRRKQTQPDPHTSAAASPSPGRNPNRVFMSLTAETGQKNSARSLDAIYSSCPRIPEIPAYTADGRLSPAFRSSSRQREATVSAAASSPVSRLWSCAT